MRVCHNLIEDPICNGTTTTSSNFTTPSLFSRVPTISTARVLSTLVDEGLEMTPPTADDLAARPVEVVRNVPYVASGQEPVIQMGANKHALDIYRPVGTGETLLTAASASFPKLLPVVLHIHGGGWRWGDRSSRFLGSPPLCTHYAEQGFLAVALSYRVQNWRNHRDDVRTAFQWVRENVAKFGGDPDTIVLSGHSAGGNIAALLAVGGDDWLDSEARASIAGCIGISGVYTLARPFSWGVGGGFGLMNRIFRQQYIDGRWSAFKPIPEERAAVLAANSPSHYLQKLIDPSAPTRGFSEHDAAAIAIAGVGDPTPNVELVKIPFLVLNAAVDMGLSTDGVFFARMLKCAGVNNVQYHQNPSGNHASICWDEHTKAKTADFLQQLMQAKDERRLHQNWTDLGSSNIKSELGIDCWL